MSDTIWKGSPASLSATTYYDEYLDSFYGRRNAPQQQAGGEAPLLQHDHHQSSRAPYKGLELSCGQSSFLVFCIFVIMPLVKFSIVCPSIWIFYKLLVAFDWSWAIAPDQMKFGTLIFLPACFLGWCTGHIVLIPIYKRIVMPGGLSVGQVPLASWEFVRLWLGMNILRLTAPIDDFLYGTMMIPIWIKLLGGKIPMNAECAAHLNTLTFVPELVLFKNESFVASHVDVGTMLVTKGKVVLSKVLMMGLPLMHDCVSGDPRRAMHAREPLMDVTWGEYRFIRSYWCIHSQPFNESWGWHYLVWSSCHRAAQAVR